MAVPNQKPVGVARPTEAVNLNPQSKDCYFYYYSQCVRGKGCVFRHCSAALDMEAPCFDWTTSGVCPRDVCPYRHSQPTRQRSVIPCYWEAQPSGCLKAHCPFLHSRPRPSPPAAHERLSQYKFSSICVKTLDELREVKGREVKGQVDGLREVKGQVDDGQGRSAATSGNVEKAGGGGVDSQVSESSPSFGLVPAVGGLDVKTAAPDLPTQQVLSQDSSKQQASSIFSARRTAASIFSPDYVSDPKNVNEVIITSPEKKFSFSIESESSDDSNLTTPTDDSNKCPPSVDMETSAVRGVKRLSSEKLEPGEMMKKPRLAQLRGGGGATRSSQQAEVGSSSGTDFHIKSLKEIRAEKQKKADVVTDKVDHVTEPISHVTEPISHVTSNVSKPPSEPGKTTKKKIVLIRRKASGNVVTNGNPPTETMETNTGGVNESTSKKLRLVRPLNSETPIQAIPPTAVIKPTSIQAISPKPSKQDATTLTSSEKLSENETTAKTGKDPVANSLSTKGERRFTSLDSEENDQLAKDSLLRTRAASPHTYCREDRAEHRPVGGAKAGVTILPDEAGLLLSPVVVEEEGGGGGRALGGAPPARKMSLAEMKAEIQSELQQQASELTAEESLDDELEKLADELVSDDTALLTDSRTDDDLMLEMEEFI